MGEYASMLMYMHPTNTRTHLKTNTPKKEKGIRIERKISSGLLTHCPIFVEVGEILILETQF